MMWEGAFQNDVVAVFTSITIPAIGVVTRDKLVRKHSVNQKTSHIQHGSNPYVKNLAENNLHTVAESTTTEAIYYSSIVHS